MLLEFMWFCGLKCFCKLTHFILESQTNGSPLASPATVPSPPAANQKPSFLTQWTQNRREQVESSSNSTWPVNEAFIISKGFQVCVSIGTEMTSFWVSSSVAGNKKEASSRYSVIPWHGLETPVNKCSCHTLNCSAQVKSFLAKRVLIVYLFNKVRLSMHYLNGGSVCKGMCHVPTTDF